jgi:hypothetical protein
MKNKRAGLLGPRIVKRIYVREWVKWNCCSENRNCERVPARGTLVNILVVEHFCLVC